MPRINRKDGAGKKPVKPDGKVNSPEEAKDLLKMVYEPACKVCNSLYRPQIDILLVRGFSVRAIEKSVKEMGEDISYRSIARHRERHLDIEAASFRHLVDQHVDEANKQIAEGAFRLISGKAWLDLFVQKGWDALLYGQLELQGRDVIQAIRLREDIMKDGLGQIEEEMHRQLQAIITAIKELVPEKGSAIAARAKELAASDDFLKQLEPPVQEVIQEDEKELLMRPIQEIPGTSMVYVPREEGGDIDDSTTLRRRNPESERPDVSDQSEMGYEDPDAWYYEGNDQRSSE